MVRGRMQHTDLAGNHLQHWHHTLLWAPVKKRGMTAWRQARWFPGSSMSMQVHVHVSCLSSCLPPARNYSPSPWWLYCHLSTHSPVMCSISLPHPLPHSHTPLTLADTFPSHCQLSILGSHHRPLAHQASFASSLQGTCPGRTFPDHFFAVWQKLIHTSACAAHLCGISMVVAPFLPMMVSDPVWPSSLCPL